MRLAFVLLAILSLAGCAQVTGQPLRPEDRTSDAVYFVERHERDNRGIGFAIADALKLRGFDAKAGTLAERPAGFDFLVTYVDRWSWDMRMYLLDLKIDIREPDTFHIVAYGRSYQDSLAAMGKTQRDIVERVLDQILGATR